MGKITQSEIKPCVVQFTEVMGYERFARDLEPEEYATIVQDITKIYDETIQLYEGHIDKHEGKVFMATFGVPVSHEEDPERAIKAALLMKQRIEQYNDDHEITLATRIGINLGKVYAGDVGSDIKKEYTVMGDTVNIAARFVDHAEEFQILVSEEIQRISKHVFRFSEPISITPQGSATKVKVYNVIDQKSGFIRRRGIEGLRSPLIGRIEPFNVIKEFLAGVMDGKGSIAALIGDAGVGKSRLIEELFTHSLSVALEKATVVNWHSGACAPYKETIYLPFVDIIRQVCDINSDDSDKTATEKLITQINKLTKDQADEFYPYIANLLNIKLDSRYDDKIRYLEPKVMKLQTHVAISTILRNHAQQAPCVYIFDDLYLADISTIEALRFFVETIKDIPMLVFLITRPEKERPFWNVLQQLKQQVTIQEIVLRRLNATETRTIAEHLLKIPDLPITLMNEMIAKAGGNPFFLEEIIKLLIAEGIVYKDGAEWRAKKNELEFSIPYTIEAIIRNRFDTLSTAFRSVLEEMSIIGRTFSKKLLQAFSTQWEELEPLIKDIQSMGFISTENEEDYSFNHALVREVIYNSIPDKRRKVLHAKIAETIEALYKERLNEYYEILFEHYSQTDDHEQAISYGLKAAQNARKRYANHEAILFYLSILKELQAKPDTQTQKRAILQEIGGIYSLIGQSADAFEVFNQALQYCDHPSQEAIIHKLMGDAHEKISDFEAALTSYERALALTDDDAHVEKARVYTGIGRVYYEQAEYEKCLQVLEQARDIIGDVVDIESRRVQASIYDRLGSTYYSIGRRAESFAYYQKALKLYEILDDINGKGIIYNNLCDYYTAQGDYPSALDNLKRSLEIDQKTGNLLGQAIVRYNIADTLYQLGDMQGAEREYHQSNQLYQQVNNPVGKGYTAWGLGLIRLEQGDLAQAETMFNDALTLFNKTGSRMWQISVMLSIVDLYIQQKEYEKTWQLLSNIERMAATVNEYNALNEVKMKQATIRIHQAKDNRKLSIAYLEEAKDNLTGVLDTMEKYGSDAYMKFEILYLLSRAYYNLGMPPETVATYRKALEAKQHILSYIEDESTRQALCNRQLFREFEAFRKQVKL
ncbi:tetratricopeptide repeat protein [candidate division WOR-3 bacterium]|nr:tetratricopeptide repeat protein [candidate division WOR-3 bacterium]